MRLESKVAIVTGAGRMRGMGRAIAVRLASEGADVVVTARSRAPESFPGPEREAGWKGAASVADEVRRLGRRGLPLDIDVTDASSVNRMVEQTRDEFGRIDILVNNAGLALVAGLKNLWEMEDDEWQREIDVNLNGVYNCCKAVARALVEQGDGGRIINISSMAGVKAQPQYGGYTPSKFAVNGLTRMLALELAPHRVTVNSVCPGSVDTDMMDGTFGRTAERMNLPFDAIKGAVKGFIPLGRQGEAAEIAALVAYLASPEAAYTTGQVICVDGGVSLR